MKRRIVMFLFANPKDYPEMIKKIAWTMFFVALLGELIISLVSSSFAEFMSGISYGIKFEDHGIKLYLSFLYFPLLFAILENVFKIHDRLSDILKIRYRFDKYVIIKKYLDTLGLSQKIDMITNRNRDKVMYKIFYAYAGYTNPSIDAHLIYMALGNWSWYWIFLDSTLVTIVIGTLFLTLSFSWMRLAGVLIIIAILILLMLIIRNSSCKEYAEKEVIEIMDDKNRRKEVRSFLLSELKQS